MEEKANRASIDLSGYPDLIVIYLGMRVTRWRGVPRLLRTGRELGAMLRDRPDGLLAHEGFLFNPRHLAFRQYWRDIASLERFTKSEPHRSWWTGFLRDPAGTGFWHEMYTRGNGMEAVYINMPPIGFARFAPARSPQGPFMTARGRLAS